MAEKRKAKRSSILDAMARGWAEQVEKMRERKEMLRQARAWRAINRG